MRIRHWTLTVVLGALMLTGCKGQEPSVGLADQQVADATQTLKVTIHGEVYTIRVTKGITDELLAVPTLAGIVWAPPQAQIGTELGRHPTEPAIVYVTPYKLGGGDLEVGAQRLITLPLTVRTDNMEQDIKLAQLVPAGNWVVLWSLVIVPGAAQRSGRIDAVNVQTKAGRFVTNARLAGGYFFDWRVQPGRVFWETRRTTPTDVEVVESVVMDLETGDKSSVPPGSAK